MLRQMDEERLDGKRLTALAHPIRIHILEVTETEAVSPSEVAVALGEPLGVVAYHFRVLHNAGLIELAATQRKRGSIQSFYRSTRPGWSELADTLRELVSGEASSAAARD
jgi:predicted transcriptional regulator